MSSTVLFSEKQRFTQWWLWLILLIVNGFIIFNIVSELVLNKSSGNKPITHTELFILGGVTFAVTLLLFMSNLETKISTDGISVRFIPFHLKFRTFSWGEFSSVNVREYSPISEYGGWGLRYGRSGKAYNISGKEGLQLEFKNGKKLLIGTKRPEELKRILERLNELRPSHQSA